MMLKLSALALAVSPALALDNGAALTPPMGWSTWNSIRCKFDEKLLLQIGQKMVDSGLKDAGYVSLNIDDCWPLHDRDADGNIVPDPKKFPDGMSHFADEVRSLGLQLGIYTAHGNLTCQGYPGSYGHEEQDAKLYAEWGVDFVKNDWCSNRPGKPAVPDLIAFNAMRDALNNSGSERPITYSIHWNYASAPAPGCSPSQSCPLPETANMWRIGGDIRPSWSSVLTLIDTNTPLAANAGPGRWNDADMLEVGNGMTFNEDQAHFTMWCMMASPLVAGNDLLTMSNATLSILTNKHAIAVNQDPLGKQATLVNASKNMQPQTWNRTKELVDIVTAATPGQVWIKPLANVTGSFAVAFLNRNEGGNDAVNLTLRWTDLGVEGDVRFDVLDLWQDAASLGAHTDSLTFEVDAASARMVKLVPTTV